MSKVALLALLIGLGLAVKSQAPELQRYMKITRM